MVEYGDWNNRAMGYGQGPFDGFHPDNEKRRMGEIRKTFSKIGFIYVIFVGVSYLSQWLTVMFLVWTGLTDIIGRNGYLLMNILGMYPLAVPLAVLLIRRVPPCGQPDKERWGIGKLGGFFVFSLGVLEAGNLVGTLLMTVAGIIKGEPIANGLNELILSMNPWTILVSAVIIAPIIEELVFRKILLDRIAGYGHWTAMTVSGVIFGIVHGNFYQFFYAFGLGMIFAYIYLHTGKIIYTIGFHMMINFIGSMIPLGLLKVIEFNAIIGGFLTLCNLMLMLGFVICAVVLFLCCRGGLVFCPAMDGLTTGKRMKAVWLNIGMILFLLCGAGLFAWSL